MRTRTFPAAAAALAVALSVSLAACSDDDDDPTVEDTPTTSATPTPTPSETATASESPTPTPTPTEEPGTVVTITIDGEKITPAGDRLEVDRDEVVTLEITSDRAGELHVHSKPEQYVEFEAGTSTHELVISAPGVVDVEEHESGQIVVQLEVH
jgi:hypothetical protein